ncbi:MAG: recombinase family protein [Schwartzia sp.]|nr:recombinase family protein [Schwartzia sp. (in: firmicutes)]
MSSDEQARHGLSLGEQRADLTKYAIEHGYIVAGIYADEGITARKAMSRRKELQRLLCDVDNGQIDIIVIKCLDRWFRNIADFYKVKERLDAAGVDWECTQEEYNTTTTNGRLMLNLKLSIAQNESDQTSDRIKYVQKGKLQRKEIIAGNLPIGLKIDGKHAVIDETTAPVVELVFDHIVNGGSVRSTVKTVYQEFGKKMTIGAVRRIIRNRSYIGEMYEIPDFLPALIPHDIFYRAQDILSRNAKPTPSGRIYLFTGLIRCPHCGRRLAGNKSRKICKDGQDRLQYSCPGHVGKNAGGCIFGRHIAEKKLETYLLDHLQTMIQEHIISLEECRIRQGRERPEVRIEALKAKLSRLEDVFLEGLMDKTKYVASYRQISQELSDLSVLAAQSLSVPANLQNIADDNDFCSTYDNLTRENRQRFWKSIISSISFPDTPETRGPRVIPFKVVFL